jgi:hypothetical protein
VLGCAASRSAFGATNKISGGVAMNPMSLPRATLFTIGALVAALLGWGALV